MWPPDPPGACRRSRARCRRGARWPPRAKGGGSAVRPPAAAASPVTASAARGRPPGRLLPPVPRRRLPLGRGGVRRGRVRHDRLPFVRQPRAQGGVGGPGHGPGAHLAGGRAERGQHLARAAPGIPVAGAARGGSRRPQTRRDRPAYPRPPGTATSLALDPLCHQTQAPALPPESKSVVVVGLRIGDQCRTRTRRQPCERSPAHRAEDGWCSAGSRARLEPGSRLTAPSARQHG